MNPPEDGLYLVRESANYPGDFTLCVAFGGKIEHYHISQNNNRLTVDDETYFDNMIKLVDVSNYFSRSCIDTILWLKAPERIAFKYAV